MLSRYTVQPAACPADHHGRDGVQRRARTQTTADAHHQLLYNGIMSRLMGQQIASESLSRPLDRLRSRPARRHDHPATIRSFVKRSGPNRTPGESHHGQRSVELAGIELRRRNGAAHHYGRGGACWLRVNPILIEPVMVHLLKTRRIHRLSNRAAGAPHWSSAGASENHRRPERGRVLRAGQPALSSRGSDGPSCTSLLLHAS